MNAALDLLAAHWLAAALLAVGLAHAALLAVRGRLHPAPLILPAVLVLLALGNLLLPASLRWWVAGGGAALLFAMVLVVVLSGYWWAPLAYLAAGVLGLGLGAA